MKNIIKSYHQILRDLASRFIPKSKIQNLSSTSSKGFSTIELLVTLFIAAAFLVSGYQLYSVIIKDGGETRQQAIASNKAYEYLQKYKAHTTLIKSTCEPHTVTNAADGENMAPTIPGLSNTELEITISCPGAQNTFEAKYYASIDATGTPYDIKRESVINHKWEDKSPIDGWLKNNFSVTWEGLFTVPETAEYKLRVNNDDGVTITITDNDTESIILSDTNNYSLGSTREINAITLESIKTYKIFIKYNESIGNATMTLELKKAIDSNESYRFFTPNTGTTTNLTPSLSKVSVTLKYGTGNPKKQVVQATYVNKN